MSRVVVPVGGTDREFVAQRWAVELADRLGVDIRGVHVVSPRGDPSRDVFEYLEKQAKKWGVELTTQVLHGADIVAELEGEIRPLDVVVIGTRRMATRYHVGSVAEGLLRKLSCPLHVVRLE